MDLVDYSQARFEEIRQDYLEFSAKLPEAEFHFIPLSALEGDNVVSQSAAMNWFDGKPLMGLLESIPIHASRNFSDFHFPVQYVNRPNLNFRGFCGTVASGVVRKGDAVTALPSGRQTRIKSIVTYDEELELASAAMAITLTLEDEIDVSRGDTLVHSDNLPATATALSAEVVWMADAQMRPGMEYTLKCGAKTVGAKIIALRDQVDINTLERNAAASLGLNEIGFIEISVDAPISFDDYRRNRAAGNFILIDRMTNITVGAGMLRAPESSNALRPRDTHTAHVTEEDRAERFRQKPVTLLFVGLSGAGKTTLAHAVERELFDRGHAGTVLDGKAMRLGISSDLDHSVAGRSENLRRSAHIARFSNDSGLICFAAFVAPTRAAQEAARTIIGTDNCLLIHLDPPLSTCESRDPSGLYAAAVANTQPNDGSSSALEVPGVNCEYEAPEDPDLVLDTNALSTAQCVDKVIALLESRHVI
jgi:bifunctional enzyme CysN/CysC